MAYSGTGTEAEGALGMLGDCAEHAAIFGGFVSAFIVVAGLGDIAIQFMRNKKIDKHHYVGKELCMVFLKGIVSVGGKKKINK